MRIDLEAVADAIAWAFANEWPDDESGEDGVAVYRSVILTNQPLPRARRRASVEPTPRRTPNWRRAYKPGVAVR